MQYDEQECRQAAAGRPAQPHPQVQRTPYRHPTVVIPAPSPGSWTSNQLQKEDLGYRLVDSNNRTPIMHEPHGPPTPAASTFGTIMKPLITPELPVDYRILLLSLSDQYITEARLNATLIAHNQPGGDIKMYYKLMATGLGCLEAVLHKHTRNMSPRQIAILQLRYATLLYDDTENDSESETLLSKGVAFCERNRLLDLKYSMQHLLSRVLFKSNVKASLKYLDNVIRDASTCQHIAWIYAFRFLRVSLLMQLSSAHYSMAALQDLGIIVEQATRRSDSAIIATSAVLEALVHLRSRDVESKSEAQRAIASARAQQLNSTTKTIPQLTALIHFVDLAGSLNPYDHVQAVKKMSSMQAYLDDTIKIDNWASDGTFAIPIMRTAGQSLTTDTGGIFTKDAEGRDCLMFSWLGRPDVYMVGFLFSGAAVYYRNPQDGRTETFLAEGLRMAEDSYQITEACRTSSLTRSCSRTRLRKILKCYMLLHQTFAKCERSIWPATQASLQAFTDATQLPGLEPPADLLRFAIYLKGVVAHATGDLRTALVLYQSPELTLPANDKQFSSPTHETLAILSTFNTLLIIRPSTHPSHTLVPELLSRLSPLFPNDPPASASRTASIPLQNPHLRSAYNLILSLLSSTTPALSNITTTKKHLKASLDLANSAANTQLRLLILSFLASAFFAGQTGDEARQHVFGAKAAAKLAGSKLWTCVADGMVAEMFEREGRGAEAGRVWEEGCVLLKGLPAGVGGGVAG